MILELKAVPIYKLRFLSVQIAINLSTLNKENRICSVRKDLILRSKYAEDQAFETDVVK